MSKTEERVSYIWGGNLNAVELNCFLDARDSRPINTSELEFMAWGAMRKLFYIDLTVKKDSYS